jgi:uncharacterized protein (TIGR03437 family)
VQINGEYMPLLYVASGQVSFQCPKLDPGTPMSLVVEGNTGLSAPLSSTMQFATPGIFSLDASGRGQGAILIANTPNLAMTPVNGIPSHPATPGGFISIYATGLGATNIAVPLGTASPVQPLAQATAPVEVFVDGQKAEVTFAGLAPGFIGLYQVDAQLPSSVTLGPIVPLQIAVHLPNGAVVSSNAVTIAVAAVGNWLSVAVLGSLPIFTASLRSWWEERRYGSKRREIASRAEHRQAGKLDPSRNEGEYHYPVRTR